MKKMLTTIGLIMMMFSLSAQSMDPGRKHLYNQQFRSAETFFHEYLRSNPGQGEAWLMLVRSYIGQDRLGAASDTLLKASTALSGDEFFMVAKGTVLLNQGKKDSAKYYFEEAINRTRGKDARILGLVAEAHADSPVGDPAWAVDLVRKALKRSKNDPWLYTTLGNAWRKLHNGGEAYKAYSAAIEKDRSYAEAHFQLGDIFRSQKNPGMYVGYFEKAIAADPNYAPAYYQLYTHYLYVDPNKAMSYFQDYTKLADKSVRDQYAYTDLLYLTKKYEEAIRHAKKLVIVDSSPVRLHKLIAYSHAELKDTVSAISAMQEYFRKAADSVIIGKDYETMAQFFASSAINNKDSAAGFYEKAIAVTTDSSLLYDYYSRLALLAKSGQDFAAQAKWLGKYYTGNERAGNVDLFNWGIAAFRAADYQLSDTVFGIYANKYPEQGFGYYWRAKSNAAIDTAMEQGLAIPHYQKLISILEADSTTASNESNKKWLKEAFAYLAAYETNTEKDYSEAITYFQKILEIEPENESAKKYIEMLEDNLEARKDSN
jgi:tetratricopeptide (TPR) repeat protein